MIKKSYNIVIEVVTGLHIGIGDDKVQIGGIDSEVIKNPVTKIPYIPGSSLKGKLRCLLETEATTDYPDGINNAKINKYFGPTSEYLKEEKKKMEETKKKNKEVAKNVGDSAGSNEGRETYEESSTRFLFRDLMMDEGQRQELKNGTRPLEVKTEIGMNRKTGTVDDAGPRTIERIPPGTKFNNVILFRYKDKDELDEMKKMLITAFGLLENDALGGSGSRGYGAVKVSHDIDEPVTPEKETENA